MFVNRNSFTSHSSPNWKLPALGIALSLALVILGGLSLYFQQHTQATNSLAKLKLEGGIVMIIGGLLLAIAIIAKCWPSPTVSNENQVDPNLLHPTTSSKNLLHKEANDQELQEERQKQAEEQEKQMRIIAAEQQVKRAEQEENQRQTEQARVVEEHQKLEQRENESLQNVEVQTGGPWLNSFKTRGYRNIEKCFWRKANQYEHNDLLEMFQCARSVNDMPPDLNKEEVRILLSIISAPSGEGDFPLIRKFIEYKYHERLSRHELDVIEPYHSPRHVAELLKLGISDAARERVFIDWVGSYHHFSGVQSDWFPQLNSFITSTLLDFPISTTCIERALGQIIISYTFQRSTLYTIVLQNAIERREGLYSAVSSTLTLIPSPIIDIILDYAGYSDPLLSPDAVERGIDFLIHLNLSDRVDPALKLLFNEKERNRKSLERFLLDNFDSLPIPMNNEQITMPSALISLIWDYLDVPKWTYVRYILPSFDSGILSFYNLSRINFILGIPEEQEKLLLENYVTICQKFLTESYDIAYTHEREIILTALRTSTTLLPGDKTSLLALYNDTHPRHRYNPITQEELDDA